MSLYNRMPLIELCFVSTPQVRVVDCRELEVLYRDVC